MMPSHLPQLKKEYDSVRPDYWNEDTRNKLIEDFTYHSTKLEGLQLNYGDTIQYLRTGLVKSHTTPKDIADLSNHREVLKRIFEDFDDMELTPESIKSLHGVLMKDRVQWGGYDPILGGAGEFKRENNFGARRHGTKEYMDSYQVKRAMSELCAETSEKLKDPKQAIEAINHFHFEFLNNIHPFSDGNGRMARLLHNMLLLKSGYPVVIIDSANKTNYIDSLIEQEENPQSNAFHKFMNKGLITSLEKAIDRFSQGKDAGMDR